jgi:Ser-tRNA(Ala) deacylase AlaX
MRLYLQDSHYFESDARIVGVREDSVAFDQSCFYPGGGGQPADEGSVKLAGGELLEIVSVQADPDDVLWHISTSRPLPAIIGQSARLIVNRERRLSLMRYHTVLHVLNTITITLRDYGGSPVSR